MLVSAYGLPYPFQSTLSMRRATRIVSVVLLKEPSISIHALHEESDQSHEAAQLLERISIHALHEESDLRSANSASSKRVFQSTLSMRRATNRRAPRRRIQPNFNPRSP